MGELLSSNLQAPCIRERLLPGGHAAERRAAGEGRDAAGVPGRVVGREGVALPPLRQRPVHLGAIGAGTGVAAQLSLPAGEKCSINHPTGWPAPPL